MSLMSQKTGIQRTIFINTACDYFCSSFFYNPNSFISNLFSKYHHYILNVVSTVPNTECI